MKKSDIKNLVREAIDTKLAKKSLREGVMSDIDIIAQESATFEEFLTKMAADPDYKSLNVNDPEVKDFLQMMYDDAAGLSEARMFTMRSLRGQAIAVLKAIGAPLSEDSILDMVEAIVAKIKKHNAGTVLAENKKAQALKGYINKVIKEEKKALKEAFESKNTTTDQFLKMIQQVKQNKLFPNAKWGFAGSMGGGTSYLPFDQFVREMTDLIKFRKDHKDPITNYYIWNMEGSGLQYGEIQKVVNAGPEAVLEFAQTQGEKVTKINTSWDSEGRRDFAAAMGRGDYGSLD